MFGLASKLSYTFVCAGTGGSDQSWTGTSPYTGWMTMEIGTSSVLIDISEYTGQWYVTLNSCAYANSGNTKYTLVGSVSEVWLE